MTAAIVVQCWKHPASTEGERDVNGRERPAGARAELSAVPAGFQGEDARAKWKAALAAHNARLRRGRFTRAAKRTGPGMIRRMPDGDDAA